MKNKLIILAGFVCLGLGAVGVFLPILPTTPFVLLAAGCFSSNKRLSAWLRKSPFFREYITSYSKRTGLSKATVIKSLVWLWGIMCITIIGLNTLWAAICLPIIAAAVTVHILYMSRPRNDTDEAADRLKDNDE